MVSVEENGPWDAKQSRCLMHRVVGTDYRILDDSF